MLAALAIAAAAVSHFIYIPVMFILGIVLGFMLGAKATRDAIALEAEEGRRARGAHGGAGRAPGRRPDSADK